MLTVSIFMITSVGFSQMSEVKDAVISKEKGIYNALKTGDMETIKTSLADDMTSVYAWGFSDRSSELEALTKLTINSYDLSDVRVMQPTDNVAIILYRYSGDGTYDGEDFSDSYYCTSTWVNMDGNWKAVLHTETPVQQNDDEDMEN